MSFCSKVKDELCKNSFQSRENIYCEAIGFFLFSKFIKNDGIHITLENKNIIQKIIGYLKYLELEYQDFHILTKDVSPQKILTSLSIYGCLEIENIINNKIIDSKNYKYKSDFLRGVFLACGNVSNPNSDYHLEFSISDINLGLKLFSILETVKECKFKASSIVRHKNLVIYIKGSDSITDFLTFIGATNSSMEFMQTKMVREVRNYINRTNNFETANIAKTANASALQIKAIKKIKQKIGLEALPEALKEIALLRIKYPYGSLEELSLHLHKPISKSGINHRFKKIIKISDEL